LHHGLQSCALKAEPGSGAGTSSNYSARLLEGSDDLSALHFFGRILQRAVNFMGAGGEFGERRLQH